MDGVEPPLSATLEAKQAARPASDRAGHTASEQKRVPATPVPVVPEAQFALPGSADGAASGGSLAEHTPLTASGSAGEPAWQRRHAALAAYLHRAEAAEVELARELEALPAEALSARASALEQRALFLSCAEADELEHAAGVLGQPAEAAGLAQEHSRSEQAGATRKRGSKRKHANNETGAAAGRAAAAGFSPVLRGHDALA